MTTDTEKFYTIARAGLPVIAAAIRLHSGRFPDLAWTHKLISQAMNAGGTTEPGGFYEVIQKAMLEIEGKVPKGTDAVVDAAYNVLHSLRWSETPDPANKPQLRTGQPGAENAIIEIRAAMTDIERAYAGLIAVVAADDIIATRTAMAQIERVYIRLQTAVAAA